VIALLTNPAFRALACAAGIATIACIVAHEAVRRTTRRLQRTHHYQLAHAVAQAFDEGRWAGRTELLRPAPSGRPYDHENDR
jgi:hypothetical protein